MFAYLVVRNDFAECKANECEENPDGIYTTRWFTTLDREKKNVYANFNQMP